MTTGKQKERGQQLPNGPRLPNAVTNPHRVRLSKTDRQFVFSRDRGICQHCWKTVNRYSYDVDHVKRVVGGGTNLVSNLLLCHSSCNRRRGNRTIAEWRAVLAAERLTGISR